MLGYRNISISVFGRVLVLGVLIFMMAACGGGGDSSATLSSSKAITAYSLNGVTGTINEANKSITVTLPYGTDVSALVATFTISGASMAVGTTSQISGTTSNDFTNPVSYIVTAEDGSTAIYTVVVSVALNYEKAITAFSLDGVVGTINEVNKSIEVTLQNGTNLTSLVATFITTGTSVRIGSVSQVSGTSLNDYTSPVVYTVTAADGSSVNYTVTVTVMVSAICGNGMLETGEQCDDGVGNGTTECGCQANCTYPVSGTVPPALAQIAGDCQQNQCNGSGGIVSVEANDDLPDSTICRTGQCITGSPVYSYQPNGWVCGAPSCSGSTYTATATCDGIGNCQTALTSSCSPYFCGVGACKTSCVSDSDCSNGYLCVMGSCQ